MPKVSVSLEFANAQEAAAFLSAFGDGGSTASTTRAPSSAPAVTTGAPPPGNASGAAPAPSPTPPSPATPSTQSAPPASAPSTAPASAPAAPPTPPAAPAAAPANALLTETLAAMQAYGKSPHKAAGIKRILAKVGMTAIKPDTSPEILTWLKSVFAPQADGTFLTPDYIETL